ncbi:hypothetical protein [Novosphingobium kaempferiae]|uniref:hypothetical protein n=1 Tax=Novosphingobium kaempferiae TaxID=2896849 RepID=UPI001E32C979|nr:hypothetical protein [Novosphingobium kaempferiae]
MPHLAKMDGPLDLGGYETDAMPQTFGRWVLAQVGRGGFIGQLATIAQSDRGFPRMGPLMRSASASATPVRIPRCSMPSMMPNWIGQACDPAVSHDDIPSAAIPMAR